MDKIKITYGIPVHDELESLTRLLNFLQLYLGEDDEILVQMDSDNVTDDVREYLTLFKSMDERHRVIEFPLNDDFGTFKTNLLRESKGDFLFQLDADEMLTVELISNIHRIIQETNVDLIFVPRKNLILNVTPEFEEVNKSLKNDKGYYQWPDYQSRIIRTTAGNGNVCWMNRVHEQLTNYDTFSALPSDELYAIEHVKNIDRQIEQTNLYSRILNN